MSRKTVAAAIAFGLIASIFIVACTSPNQNQTPPTTPAEAVPTPEPGLATVAGRLVNTGSREPYVNTVIRLGEVIHFEPGDEGTWFIDDAVSPGDYTDEAGRFVIANVQPKEYVLVVGDFNMRYAVVTDTPDTARVWNVTPDAILDMGELDVVLP